MALAETWCHMKKKTLEEGGETRANTDVESVDSSILPHVSYIFP
jgi:hypothetical protein